jgi:hypothetical protein
LEPPNAIERILFTLERGMNVISLDEALALEMLIENLLAEIAIQYCKPDRMSLEIDEIMRKELTKKRTGKQDRPST